MELSIQASGPTNTTKLAGLLLLGALRAVEIGAMKTRDVEYQLFMPHTARRFRECDVAEGICHIIDSSVLELATLEEIDRPELVRQVQRFQQELVQILEGLDVHAQTKEQAWIQ